MVPSKKYDPLLPTPGQSSNLKWYISSKFSISQPIRRWHDFFYFLDSLLFTWGLSLLSSILLSHHSTLKTLMSVIHCVAFLNRIKHDMDGRINYNISIDFNQLLFIPHLNRKVHTLILLLAKVVVTKEKTWPIKDSILNSSERNVYRIYSEIFFFSSNLFADSSVTNIAV